MIDNNRIPIEESYPGEFEDVSFDGYGAKCLSEGEKYVGEFRNGVYNGRGIYTWPEGKNTKGNSKMVNPMVLGL